MYWYQFAALPSHLANYAIRNPTGIKVKTDLGSRQLRRWKWSPNQHVCYDVIVLLDDTMQQPYYDESNENLYAQNGKGTKNNCDGIKQLNARYNTSL